MAKAADLLLSPPKKSVWLPVNGQADGVAQGPGNWHSVMHELAVENAGATAH
jgi:hypothetical protein